MTWQTKSCGGGCELGVEWNENITNTQFSVAQEVWRYDAQSTDNYGSTFGENMKVDSTSIGSWYGIGWGSGAGWREVDSFATRTYDRTHSSRTVKLTISTDSEFGTWNGGWIYLGAGDYTFTLTIPAKPSYTISYAANGGSGAPSSQTKWYGETLTLSSTKPTRSNATTDYTVTYNYNYSGKSNTTATATKTTKYTFNNWKSTGGTTYAPSSSYTSNAGTTMTAQWTSSTSTSSVPLPTPTRTCYTFNGWYTASSGGTKIGNGGASYTPSASTTLYAHWTEITYTVSYAANGGSGAPSAQTKYYTQTLTLSSTKPTRSNATATYTVTYNYNYSGKSNTTATATKTTKYTFANWKSTAGTAYSPGGSYSTNASTTMTAQWTSSASTTSVTLPTPTRDGYDFNGWYNASSGGTKIGNGGASYTPTATITLYAHWTESVYTVSYNANGGSGAPSSQTKQKDQALTLTNTKPTRTGYTFSKWNTQANGSGTNYNPGGSYTANASATLYAQWNIVTYTVSYAANGGSSTPSSQSKEYGNALTLRAGISRSNATTTYTVTFDRNGSGAASTTATATKTTSYTFSKWKATDGTTYNASGSYTKNEATTMTAQWTSSASTTSVTLPNITWTGHTLDGWYTASSGGTKVGAGGASYTPSATVTLYAHWITNTYTVSYAANGGSSTPASQTKTYGVALTLKSAISRANATTTYTVTYNANSGSVSPASDTATKTTVYAFDSWKATDNTLYSAGGSYTKNEGTTMTAQWTSSSSTTSVTLPTPTRTGYTFNGWYTAASGGTKKGGAGASYTPTANITLYAQWTIITYSIKYNANGGSGAPSTQTKTYGQALTMSSTIPTRSKCKFLGWATSSSATTASKQPGDTIAASSNADATYYAVWSPEPQISNMTTIRCDKNGNPDDTGAYCITNVEWTVDQSINSSVQSGAITYAQRTASSAKASGNIISYFDTNPYYSGNVTSTPFSADTDKKYTITITVTAGTASVSRSSILTRVDCVLDFKAGGHGLGIGRVAPATGMAVGWPTQFDDEVTMIVPLGETSGGTGQNTLRKSANALINALSAGTANVIDDNTLIITQNTDATTAEFLTRPISKLWNWIKGKANDLYYRLDNGVSLNVNDDLNDYTTPGTYYKSTNSEVQTLSNCPVTVAFKMVVENTISSNYGIQTIYEWGDGVQYQWKRRWYVSSGTTNWSSWFRSPPGSSTAAAQNRVLATPSSAAGLPAYRALVNADLPTVNVAHGGTGETTVPEAFHAIAYSSSCADLDNEVYGYCYTTTSTANRPSTVTSGGYIAITFSTNDKAIRSQYLLTETCIYARRYASSSWGDWRRVWLIAPTASSNLVLATPNGSSGYSTYRSLVNADLPTVNIGHGGTGQTGVSTEDTIANVITQTTTQSDAYEITSAKFYQWGKIAHLYFVFKPAAAVSAGTNLSIGTISSGMRPIAQAPGGSGYLMGAVTAAGAVSARVRTALTAGTTYAFSAVYLLP